MTEKILLMKGMKKLLKEKREKEIHQKTTSKMAMHMTTVMMFQTQNLQENETTESADAELLGSSESEPLMFSHYSEEFRNHPDKPTVQCPECPQKFFYQGGLRHHMETHDRAHDVPTFQCLECTDKFYYRSGLDHHYETHVRQQRRESGLYSQEENNHTMETSDKKDIPQKRNKHSKRQNSKNATPSKKNKKTINSDGGDQKGSGSIISPSNAEDQNTSINSDLKKKAGRGRGRPRKTGKLPKRHKGKLIKTEADLNTSEDTERQKDIEEGKAALDRYKKKKRDEEEALFASIQASYNLRSAGDLCEKSINKEVSNKQENSNPDPEQPEKEKPTKNQKKKKRNNSRNRRQKKKEAQKQRTKRSRTKR